jgi:hypothetical protein
VQREVAAFGFVQQASGETRANGMQLHLGDRALEAEKKPAVRGARIIRAHRAIPLSAQCAINLNE